MHRHSLEESDDGHRFGSGHDGVADRLVSRDPDGGNGGEPKRGKVLGCKKNTHPTIQVAGRKKIPLKIGSDNFSMNVTAAGVRKPLISLGDMMDKGWDVHLHAQGPYYAVKADGTTLKSCGEGNRFRLDAEVVLPPSGQSETTFAGQGRRP